MTPTTAPKAPENSPPSVPTTTAAAVRRVGVANGHSIEEALALIPKLPVWSCWDRPRQEDTISSARSILRSLRDTECLPGAGWQQRWAIAGVEDNPMWREQLAVLAGRDPARCDHRTRAAVKHGLFGLMLVDAIVLGYRFLSVLRLFEPWYQDVRTVVAAEQFLALENRAAELGLSAPATRAAMQLITKMALYTGRAPFDIGLSEFDAFHAAESAAMAWAPGGTVAAWDLLRGRAIPADMGYREHHRVGQRDTAAIVDSYGLRPGSVRDVLIRYLDERRPAMDYTSFHNMCGQLVGAFWADIEQHHPDVASLALPADVAMEWKQRLRYTRRPGVPPRLRRDYLDHLMQVRAFYLTVAEWAQSDPTWAEHAVACPIRRAETRGVAKQRRHTIAAVHQRIRERFPRLSELVDTTGQHHRDRVALLEAAQRADPGQTFTYGGATYVRVLTQSRARFENTDDADVLADNPSTGRRHNLRAEEDDAFWAWAIIEVLRHTGVRLEELLELTHLALVQHRLADTGEIVPLLQIVPSKTDQERLLLVSPELASVLATIIHRLRRVGGGSVPIVERYDHYERANSPALPHLFQRRVGHRHRVISVTTVQNLINRAIDRSGLSDA